MKRFTRLLAALLLLATILVPVLPVQAAETNLITNPSTETDTTGNTALPAGWTKEKWGTNTTTLSRKNEGHTGTKSLYVNTTAYTTGDAKWLHTPVNITGNTSYTFTNWYKSNVATEVILKYTDAANTATYVTGLSTAASATWKEQSLTFTTPATATKVTVLHLINKVGWLQTDDYSVAASTTTPPVDPPPTGGANLIANASFETANGTAPASWTSNKWGTNTATFTHPTTGRTGTRSAKVAITAYTDGDAKWYASPVAVTAGKSYTYTDYYKSSVATDVVAAYQNAAGTFTYTALPSAPASATAWAPYTATLTVPANITKVSVYHLLNKVGTLTLDDVSLTENTTDPTPPTGNLVANPSFMTASGANPASWTSNKWGVNTTAFTYDTVGRTDARSAKVAITAYTDGDAKWYASPVAVTAGKTYTYSDYYKSGVATQVIVAYITASGTYSYAPIGTAPASAAAWSQFTGTFTVPAGTAQATIFHTLQAVGTLSIDDVSLTENVANPTPGNPILNPSVETGASTPANWTTSGWGTNSPTYEYVNEGHTGTKSVKLTMANHTDGDAKWMFAPVTSLEQGHQYRFTAWYKTNTLPETVTMFTFANGTVQYFGMPDAQPAANAATVWQKYSDTFSVPQGAVSVSIFMFLNKNGWLQTDDYSIENYTPTGFNRSLVTLTFDDGHEENAANALPLLEQYGYKSTQCFATTFIEGQPQATLDKVLAFKNAGHEICSHSVTHPMMTTLDDATLDYEARHSQEYLQQLTGQPVLNFATPYGDYNQRVNNVLDNYYQAHRSVDEGYNSKDNFDKYRLRVQNILDTTTAAQVKAWVEQAQADKTWLILVYHRIADNPGPYDSKIADFQAQLQAIQQAGAVVKTYQEALTEVMGQL